MENFFKKHSVALDASHAIDHIISTARKVKKYYDKNKDYVTCMKELDEMIDDFLEEVEE